MGSWARWGLTYKDLRYIPAQFQDLIRVVENLTGQTFDIDRVREAVRESNDPLLEQIDRGRSFPSSD